MRARIRDTELYFDIDGAGLVSDGSQMRERPTAFIIHGGPGVDHTGMKVRYGALTERMQLVYFDHRGQGRSARGRREQYTLDETVKDMEALRQHLGLGPIVSLGTSYGGMVAMAHAARYPDAVSHLILVVTAAQPGYLERARQIVLERGTPAQVAMCDDFLQARIDTPEKYRRFFDVMASLYSRKFTPETWTGVGPVILEPDAMNLAHGPRGFMRSVDLRPELAAITAPTLILGARHDWICAPEFSEEIHRAIPGSDLRIFEESGHMIGADEQQKFLDAVKGFVVYNTRRSG